VARVVTVDAVKENAEEVVLPAATTTDDGMVSTPDGLTERDTVLLDAGVAFKLTDPVPVSPLLRDVGFRESFGLNGSTSTFAVAVVPKVAVMVLV